MVKPVKDRQYYIKLATKKRCEDSVEKNCEVIDELFKFPLEITREDVNMALLNEDTERLSEIRALMAKCKAKRERLKEVLHAVKSPEERDAIMCSVTPDLDAEY